MNSTKADLDRPPYKRANILLRLLGPGLVVAEAFGWPATLEARAAQALRPLAGDLTFVLFA